MIIVSFNFQRPKTTIYDILQSLTGFVFSTLDLAACGGYWQVELQETAEEESAFVTPMGFKIICFCLFSLLHF